MILTDEQLKIIIEEIYYRNTINQPEAVGALLTNIIDSKLSDASEILSEADALTAEDDTDLSTELDSFPDTLGVINNLRTRLGEIETILQSLGL